MAGPAKTDARGGATPLDTSLVSVSAEVAHCRKYQAASFFFENSEIDRPKPNATGLEMPLSRPLGSTLTCRSLSRPGYFITFENSLDDSCVIAILPCPSNSTTCSSPHPNPSAASSDTPAH